MEPVAVDVQEIVVLKESAQLPAFDNGRVPQTILGSPRANVGDGATIAGFTATVDVSCAHDYLPDGRWD